MSAGSVLTLVVALACPSIALAQHAGAAPAPTAPVEAKQHDFLVGHWELTVKVPPTSLATRIHGMPKLVGTWKAWRAFDGFGIEDELRISDAAGNPLNLSHSLRYYDRTTRLWSVTTLDVYRGKVTPLSASWADGKMLLESRGVDAEGKAYISRSRFYDITPNTFKFQQDRSFDEGKKWTVGTLSIEATRVALSAPR